MIFSYLLNMQSHPSWVCGLKLQPALHLVSALPVTPFVGVWIETRIVGRSVYEVTKSHPSWVCGLKQCLRISEYLVLWSHPSWVCGLKHWNQDRADRWHVSHPSWVCGLKQNLDPKLQPLK